MSKIRLKKSITSILLVVIISAVLIGCNSSIEQKQLTTKEKLEDFEYMYNIIKEEYPFLGVNKRVFNVDWLDNKEDYIKRIKDTENDIEFIREINKILSELNNNHTHIISSLEQYKMFKEVYGEHGWYDFWEVEEVISRYENIEDCQLPSKSISTENYILEDIIEGQIGYIYIPEMMPRRGNIQEDIEEITEYIKTLKGHKGIIIDIRGNTGGADRYWQEIISRIIPKDYKNSGYILFRSGDITDKYIESREVDTKSIEELPKSIIDNGPEEIVNDFSSFTNSDYILYRNNSIEFNGKIFLLVDESVYSAAETFAMFCKENELATLIGETTGGDGCGYDPLLFNLSNSGLIVRMASNMYLTGSGLCNEEFKTTPDYFIEDVDRTKDFEDDKCIQKAIELMGELD